MVTDECERYNSNGLEEAVVDYQGISDGASGGGRNAETLG
jgi:hypothetical protein